MAAALGGEVWKDKEVHCPGPNHSRGDRSLSVTLNKQGDDIVVHSFGGDNWLDCLKYVRDRLGIQPLRKASWQEIWSDARHPRATLVERYLISRKLVLLPEAAGAAVRFHEACPFGLATTPAMVCLVRDVRSDEPIGVHRTALDALGRKREIDGKSRMALGKIAGGAIKLTPGVGLRLRRRAWRLSAAQRRRRPLRRRRQRSGRARRGPQGHHALA
jgi:putative DNA primase/helicase